MKSPALSLPRKYQITNQDIIRLNTQQDPILSLNIAKYPTKYKRLFSDRHHPNYAEYDSNDSTYNSRNENEDYVNKLKVNINENNDDE